MIVFRQFAAVVCLFSMVPSASPAQDYRPLSIEETIAARIFSEASQVEVSPDGKWIAYAVRENAVQGATRSVKNDFFRHGLSWYGSGSQIYIEDTASTSSRMLTGGTGNNWQPRLSPDGNYLAFLSDRDGSGQAKLWVWEAKANKLRKVSDIAVRTSQIEWLPGSKNVILTTVPEGLTPDEFAERSSKRDNSPVPGGTEDRTPGSTVVLYRSNVGAKDKPSSPASEPWSLENQIRDLVMIDVGSGSVRRLAHNERIPWFIASPDGAHVAFGILERFERPGAQQIVGSVNVVSTANSQLRLLASGIRLFYINTMRWSPDSQWLSYRTAGPDANGDCFVVSANGGAPRNVTNFPPESVQSTQPAAWSADGQTLWFIRSGVLWRASVEKDRAIEAAKLPGVEIKRLVALDSGLLWSGDGGRSTIVLGVADQEQGAGFYEINLITGKSRKLIGNHQCFTCGPQFPFVTVMPGQKLLYSMQDAQHDTDLWLTDGAFNSPRRLTHINPQFDQYEMGAARLVEWRSLDGEPLRGALLLPVGFKEGKKYPLIVKVYGGSLRSQELERFGLSAGSSDNGQLFATRGYAVLLPDAPTRQGTPMVDLAKTVMPGVQKLIDMGIADPDRLGVMGHSYGGYAVLSLIVQTKRFKAAMEADGMGDLIAAYGQMGKDGSAYLTAIAETGQGGMGGTPWQFRERYIENSPIFFLDRVDTPLLIVHGAEDTAVAPYLGDEVFVALRRLGKEVEYAKYEGEDHSPLYWSYANQVDYCKRVIAWFDKYLKP